MSNRTLQRLFNLSMFGARDLLRDLQRRGIIVKLSAATSGSGVVYGPSTDASGTAIEVDGRH